MKLQIELTEKQEKILSAQRELVHPGGEGESWEQTVSDALDIACYNYRVVVGWRLSCLKDEKGVGEGRER